MPIGNSVTAIASTYIPTKEDILAGKGIKTTRQSTTPSVVIDKSGNILWGGTFDKMVVDIKSTSGKTQSRAGKFIVYPIPTEKIILFQDTGERYDKADGRKATVFEGNIIEANSNMIRSAFRTMPNPIDPDNDIRYEIRWDTKTGPKNLAEIAGTVGLGGKDQSPNGLRFEVTKHDHSELTDLFAGIFSKKFPVYVIDLTKSSPLVARKKKDEPETTVDRSSETTLDNSIDEAPKVTRIETPKRPSGWEK
jgi:hypothetical protein